MTVLANKWVQGLSVYLWGQMQMAWLIVITAHQRSHQSNVGTSKSGPNGVVLVFCCPWTVADNVWERRPGPTPVRKQEQEGKQHRFVFSLCPTHFLIHSYRIFSKFHDCLHYFLLSDSIRFVLSVPWLQAPKYRLASKVCLNAYDIEMLVVFSHAWAVMVSTKLILIILLNCYTCYT